MSARFLLGGAYAIAATAVTSSSWNTPSPLTPRPPTSSRLVPVLLVMSLYNGALPGKNTTPLWLSRLYGSWKFLLGLKSAKPWRLVKALAGKGAPLVVAYWVTPPSVRIDPGPAGLMSIPSGKNGNETKRNVRAVSAVPAGTPLSLSAGWSRLALS